MYRITFFMPFILIFIVFILWAPNVFGEVGGVLRVHVGSLGCLGEAVLPI